MSAPRLYVLPASQAQVALVIRRGPSRWWHLLRWDLADFTLSPGAWFHGILYPRRSAISPDGELFGYFVLKGAPTPDWPQTYFAVAKTPWLTALAAWETIGTWTGGCTFDEHRSLTVYAAMHPTPFHGHYPYGFIQHPLDHDWVRRDVACELARGWEMWNPEGHRDLLELPFPAEPAALLLRSHPLGLPAQIGLAHLGTSFATPAIEGAQIVYFLRDRETGSIHIMKGVTWADWSQDGRLLTGRRNGVLEVLEASAVGRSPADWNAIWQGDLNGLAPNPQPSPPDARQW